MPRRLLPDKTTKDVPLTFGNERLQSEVATDD
jgi:hypothetical protein